MEKKPEKSAEKPDEKEPREKQDEPSTRKPGYVFKIVPADPKNAFDFEDVADK